MQLPAEAISCSEAAEALPSVLDGNPARVEVLEHVDACLRCQAELVRYRRLLRLLHQLRAERAQLPPGLVADVLDVLGAVAQRQAVHSMLRHRRVAYATAVVFACSIVASVIVAARSRTAQQGRPIEN